MQPRNGLTTTEGDTIDEALANLEAKPSSSYLEESRRCASRGDIVRDHTWTVPRTMPTTACRLSRSVKTIRAHDAAWIRFRFDSAAVTLCFSAMRQAASFQLTAQVKLGTLTGIISIRPGSDRRRIRSRHRNDHPNCLLPLRQLGHGDRRTRARVGLPLPQLQEAFGQRLRGAGALALCAGQHRGTVEDLRHGRRQRQQRHLPLLPGLRVGRLLPEQRQVRRSVAIPLGAFDNPFFVAPAFSVWDERKHDWVEIIGRQSSIRADMFDQYATDIAHTVAKIVELFGIAIIAFGAFGTLAMFASRMRKRSIATRRSRIFVRASAARSCSASNSSSPPTSSTPSR